MLAGRSHCLRRFFLALTVTKRKFHYIQMIAAGPPPSIGRCPACGVGVFRSVSFALGKRSLPFRLETSWRARRPALCMPLLAVCARFAVLFSYEAVLEEKLCPHTPVHFQAKNKRAINSIFSDTPPCGAGCVQPKCQQRPCLCPLPLAMAAWSC